MSDLIKDALKYIEKPKPKPPTLWDKIKGLYFMWKMRKYTKAIKAQVGVEKDPKYMMTEQEQKAYEAKQRIQLLIEAQNEKKPIELEDIIEKSKNRFNRDY